MFYSAFLLGAADYKNKVLLTQGKANNISTKECYTSQCPNDNEHCVTIR